MRLRCAEKQIRKIYTLLSFPLAARTQSGLTKSIKKQSGHASMLEETSNVLVSTAGKTETFWKFAKKGTLFVKKPIVGKDSIHIFKDLTQIYSDNASRKSKRRWANIFWVEGERVQRKLTQKEESVIVKKFYNDRGRESIDWSEAETYQNRLRDAETGPIYFYLPHSLWKKHITSSKQKQKMGSEENVTRFSFDQDVKMIKKWGKQSMKFPPMFADQATRDKVLETMRKLQSTKRGYSEDTESDVFDDLKMRRTISVKKLKNSKGI